MRVASEKATSGASDEPEKVEYRLGWRRVLRAYLPLALILLSAPVATLLVLFDDYEIRWPVVTVVGLVTVMSVWWQSRITTTADRHGLAATEIGRPWRWPRRTTVPWRDIVAIKVRRQGKAFVPMVHLAGGGWMMLRVPVDRRADRVEAAVAEMLSRRPAVGGGPADGQVALGEQVRWSPAPPPARRRALIVSVTLLVLVVDCLVLAQQLVDMAQRPPKVMSCDLIPSSLPQRLLSGIGTGTGHVSAKSLDARPESPCAWQTAADEDSWPDGRLNLSVYSLGAHYLAERYTQERAKDRARHVIHPIAGVRGFTWSAVDGDVADAEGYAVVGGYRIEAKLDQSSVTGKSTRARRLDAAQTEQRVAELIRSAAEKLRTVRGWRS